MSIHSLFDQLKAEVVGFEWPNVLTGETASLFSTLFDLNRTERLPPVELEQLQNLQLERLLRHAAAQVPFYADRLKKAGYRPGKTPVAAIWDAIPILTRSEIQAAGDRLHARTYPPSHGASLQRTTSGSTSRPVRIVTTAFADFLWRCVNMRDRMWHDIDLGETLVRLADVVQMKDKPIVELDSWSLPRTVLRGSARQFKVNPSLTVAEQIRAICKINPAYLHTRPSQLNLLVKECATTGQNLGRLKAVFCVSEPVAEPLRDACRAVLGVPILDCYSCAEMGYLALQCPAVEHFHVQSEMVRVEILKADGKPCAPGETGRVIATSLHNYAMPLIRYEIGDEAEAGATCPCGRGLPVIAKISGRTQDYVKLRSGHVIRADLHHYEIAEFFPSIVEFQVVQRALGRLEILVVANRPLDANETRQLATLLETQGGEVLDVAVTPCETIERARSGKLRAFICEVP